MKKKDDAMLKARAAIKAKNDALLEACAGMEDERAGALAICAATLGLAGDRTNPDIDADALFSLFDEWVDSVRKDNGKTARKYTRSFAGQNDLPDDTPLAEMYAAFCAGIDTCLTALDGGR